MRLPVAAMGDYRAILSDQVLALVTVEAAIEEALRQQSDLTLPLGELHASLEAIRGQAGTQRQSLENYLRENGGEPTIPRSAIAPLLAEAFSSGNPLRVLSADYTAFNYAASEYSVLLELALHLYDPALRKLAPQHLRTYTRAVQLLIHLVPRVVVGELNRQGLGCRCICPMCSIGACGCTAAGHAWIDEAWSEARPQIDSEPGLAISPPRQGSQLAALGGRGGDRLLAVDDQPIVTFMDVQKAIRKHEIGDEVVFRVAHGAELSRDIRIKHVSDYPRS